MAMMQVGTVGVGVGLRGVVVLVRVGVLGRTLRVGVVMVPVVVPMRMPMCHGNV
jgi:hypothetical protein